MTRALRVRREGYNPLQTEAVQNTNCYLAASSAISCRSYNVHAKSVARIRDVLLKLARKYFG
jgi:hypothetical protein